MDVATDLYLNDDQIAELTDAFRMFDIDGDGSISPDELSRVMKSLGKNHSDVEIQEMVEEFDADKNGTIEVMEFLQLMSKKMKDLETQDDLRSAFNILDRSGTGLVTCKELQFVMNNMGEMLSDDEIQDMIRVADKDNDGKINFKDFLELVTNSK